ncbi:MAG: response regulator [Bacteroidales bacterium]|nr:response regulator [Bacteroidales bacterium]
MVYSILQDSRGFMWFATSVGLCRYDGYTMKVFLTDPSDSTSISGNFIYSNLIEDDNGNLWIGTIGNGLNRYNRAKGTFTRFKFDAAYEGSISNNKVYAILLDKSENIWIGTEYGLNKLKDSIEKFNHYLPKHNIPHHPANKILSLFEDSEGVLWVGTGDGVYTLDCEKKTYYLFNLPNQPFAEITNKEIYAIHEDVYGMLWFGTSWGLYKYDRNISSLLHFFPDETDEQSLSNNSIYHIYEDKCSDGKFLWISTVWGLNRLDIASGNVFRIYHDPDDPGSIGSNKINASFVDETGRLWVATEYRGISYTDLLISQFNYVHIERSLPDTTGHTATTFIKDNSGNLIVGTMEGGLFKYDSQFQLIARYEDDLFDKNSLGFSFIFNLVLLPDNNLLISTVNNGLFRLNLLTSDLDNFSFRNKDSIIIKPIIREVFKDSQGYLWVGTKEGLFLSKDNNNKSLQLIDHNILSTAHIHAIYEDKSNGFYVGTIGQGLFYQAVENRNTHKFIQFKNESNNRNSISNDLITCIIEDSKNQLWVGTNNGINKYTRENESFIRYSSVENPGANFIYFIQEDNDGNIWMTTQAGLVRFNPKGSGEHQFRVYSVDDGLPFDNIYLHSFFISNEGRMFIGGEQESGNSFFWFPLAKLNINSQIPPIVITDFKVQNKPITLDSNINEIRHIRLNYKQNYFSFEFSALNFINSEKNQYAYKLEGLDKDWIYCGSRRFVGYSGISPGDYIFRVKGSNNDGCWNEKGKTIRITISSPPWATWWAYFLYVLLIIGLIYAWRRYDLKRQQLRQQLNIERVEADKLKELDSMKSRFFANISHEFRTPLTLILGPVEKVLTEIKDGNIFHDLRMVQRNAKRLQKLINQLLDLSKLESGKLKLQAKEVNITDLVRKYVQSFEFLAKQKNIELNFKSDKEHIPLYVDQDKIEKILNNLLSNAFKFTPVGGSIKVSLGRQSTIDNVIITISDTGPGIPADKLSHIFDRFYQVDDSASRTHEGTGIGLALTMELVDLHHGTISVESEEGNGTTFAIMLPSGKEHLKEEEILGRDKSAADIDQAYEELIAGEEIDHGPIKHQPNIWHQDSKPIILVVEDNADLRDYIHGFLDESYQVMESGDGEAGLQQAIEAVPDLIISDVMMPKMDGYQLCQKLKTDERTSHIPLILLTARAGTESRIEGLETGADDFITKPFDSQELLVRINNLIEQRRILTEKLIIRAHNNGIIQWSQLSDTGITSMEQQFLQKAGRVVEDHLSDPDFKMDMFSKEMALSHSQLYRKLNALINQSPNEFIRTTRLQKAAHLLAKKSANVSEIALEVGFNNPSYFAECFRKQFGVLPSKYS